MAKSDKFYFDNFSKAALLSKKAAVYLADCLENYDPENIERMLREMHEIEHAADVKKHEMSDALAKAFVTPFDREDLDLLSHNLDRVVDKIEETLQKFYIYNITSVQPEIIEFSKEIVASCDLLCLLMSELENFKRSKKIRELIVKMNDEEEKCDKLYLSAMRNLTLNATDILSVISWREIYECIEACADSCEHVSECVGTVVMKNT